MNIHSIPQCDQSTAILGPPLQQNYHINSKLCLTGDLKNKCAERGPPQCHQQTPFSRSSSKLNSIGKHCLSGDLNNEYAVSPSITNERQSQTLPSGTSEQ